MEQFTQELENELNASLKDVLKSNHQQIEKLEHAFHVVKSILMKLKSFMLDYTFSGVSEEVLFYKTLKPRFQQEYIYYSELIYIEMSIPKGNAELLTRYYEQVMERLHLYYDRNQLLYNYYRMGRTWEDEVLFLQNSEGVGLFPENNLDLDSRFSTVNSSKLSKIMAFERIEIYLADQISWLIHGNPKVEPNAAPLTKIIWTDSKADLTELAYAIHSKGSLNGGNIDLKHIIQALEHIFNCNTGNFYRTYLDLTLRKKSRTPFLESLTNKLLQRMEDDDK